MAEPPEPVTTITDAEQAISFLVKEGVSRERAERVLVAAKEKTV